MKLVPTTREKIEERRVYAAGLRSAGFSIESVYQKVCAMGEEKKWGTPAKSTVEKDIAEYYKRNRALTVEDFEYMESMRESHIAQMEHTLEKMSIHVSDELKEKKKKWSPFEYADALEKLHKAQMNMAEIQDWNRGSKKGGVNINIQQNTVNAIFDAASADLKKMQEYTPKVLKNLIVQIDNATDKIKDQEYKIKTELTDDDEIASQKFIERNGG